MGRGRETRRWASDRKSDRKKRKGKGKEQSASDKEGGEFGGFVRILAPLSNSWLWISLGLLNGIFNVGKRGWGRCVCVCIFSYRIYHTRKKNKIRRSNTFCGGKRQSDNHISTFALWA